MLLGVVAIYGGHSGAGSGITFLELCSLGTPLTTHESVLLKTPLIAVANIVASMLFIVAGQVDCAATIAVGLGSFVGGLLGPQIQRLIPERVMRLIVVVGGLVLTAWLFVEA